MGFCVSKIRLVLNSGDFFPSFNCYSQTIIRTFILFPSFIVIIVIIKDSFINKIIPVSLHKMARVKQFIWNTMLIQIYLYHLISRRYYLL